MKSAVLSQPANHCNLLRTIGDLYGLEPLGAAKDAAPLTGWAR